MSVFIDWFRRTFDPDCDKDEDVGIVPEEWDPVSKPLEGGYPEALIEEAEIIRTQKGMALCKVKCRLEPDDPDDTSYVFVYLAQMPYLRLLKNLGIKKTNNVSVLVGRNVQVRVHPVQSFSSGIFADTFYQQGHITEAETEKRT